MRHLAQKARKTRAAGFSYFEIAIVAIIFVLLTGLFLQRIFNYQRQVEVLGAEQTAAIIRSALVVKTGQYLAQNRAQDIPQLVDQNPMEWLTRKPHNYRGEYFSPELDDLPGGIWFFDRKTKTLVYLLNVGKTFPGGIPKSLKFKVKLNHSLQGNISGQQIFNVTSVSLVQVDA